MESLQYFLRLKREYQEKLRETLLGEAGILSDLLKLERAIILANEAFESTGSFTCCAKCAKQGIVCCGEGLEWKLSQEEFFLNLALLERKGKELDLEKYLPERCLFLGNSGCKLPLPPLLCRNFFCSHLKDYLGQAKLTLLQKALGPSALLAFKLGEKLKRF